MRVIECRVGAAETASVGCLSGFLSLESLVRRVAYRQPLNVFKSNGLSVFSRNGYHWIWCDGDSGIPVYRAGIRE